MSWQYKLCMRASPLRLATRPNNGLLLRPSTLGAAGRFSAWSGTWDDGVLPYIDGGDPAGKSYHSYMITFKLFLLFSQVLYTTLTF